MPTLCTALCGIGEKSKDKEPKAFSFQCMTKFTTNKLKKNKKDDEKKKDLYL